MRNNFLLNDVDMYNTKDLPLSTALLLIQHDVAKYGEFYSEIVAHSGKKHIITKQRYALLRSIIDANNTGIDSLSMNLSIKRDSPWSRINIEIPVGLPDFNLTRLYIMALNVTGSSEKAIMLVRTFIG